MGGLMIANRWTSTAHNIEVDAAIGAPHQAS
jgi:hypothetical protein